MNETSNNVIKLSDIIRIIIKHKKIGISVFILFLVATLFFTLNHTKEYSYKLSISGPTFQNMSTSIQHINCPTFSRIANQKFNLFAVENLQLIKKYNVKSIPEKCEMGLTATGTEDQAASIKQISHDLINSIYSDKKYLTMIENWKKFTSDAIPKIGMNNANLISSNTSEAFLKALIQDRKAVINSLDEKPSKSIQMTRSLYPTNMSKIQIFVLGLVLSIIISLFSIFTVYIISNVRQEFKDNN
ncbi:hypothetical protein CF386_03150 [Paraphotobacterium marinum]|uniref:Polysaccharide chain length determinant N-terminal domain-containing protein n=1 Tax=Paraphotobacterium marinum TaxID=1755811 RepID=A0A220VD45_9GAMM|nr:hypothetical protein [Paraphotobacterium marinum]ASK78102.1 hypothetical protein CF386_03150 [Paraphotobacterium marinum]